MKPFVLIHCDDSEYAASLRADARSGLSRRPPALPSRWCFDGYGRRLFARLAAGGRTHMFRAEANVLTHWSRQLATATAARHLIQVGLRAALPQVLTDALTDAGTLTAVSRLDTPHAPVDDVRIGFPQIDARHLVVDLAGPLPDLAEPLRLIHCPALAFASLDRNERHRLLLQLRHRCDPGDHLLVAAPLSDVLSRHRGFFNDNAGLGDALNCNVVNVINHTLDADANSSAFDHTVEYHPSEDRLDLRLRARVAQRIELRTLGFHIDLDTDEELRTLRLFGFAADDLAAELRQSGFETIASRHDAEQLVTLTLASVSGK